MRASIDINKLVRLYKSGVSQKELANRFKIARTAILPRLLHAGVVIRGRIEANRLMSRKRTTEQNIANTRAAHNAVRGCRQSEEHRCKIALTRELRGLGISRIERKILDGLVARGFQCTAQRAVGRYNIDVTINEPPIAVEIFGGHWHSSGRHAARHRKRIDYLLNRGWTVVCIWVTIDYPIEDGCFEYLVSTAKKLSGDKSSRCKEYMIRGDGQLSAIGKNKLC